MNVGEISYGKKDAERWGNLVSAAMTFRYHMQFDLDMAAIKGTIDEMSLYFRTEGEVAAFKLWALDNGYTNPNTDISPYFDTNSVRSKAKVNQPYDRIVLMEFLYNDALLGDWHFEVRTYLGDSVIPDYLDVASGTVLFGSFKVDWDVYDQTFAQLADAFGDPLRMFEGRYGVCSDVGTSGHPPYYHVRTRRDTFAPWERES